MLNLSRTGIFVATQRKLFDLGAAVSVTVKTAGLLPAFHAKARVARYNTDPSLPVGYGLHFEAAPDALAHLERLGQPFAQGIRA